MARATYNVANQTAAVALAAATAKSVIGAAAGADFGLSLLKYKISFDGVTASAIPVLVELCSYTGAPTATSYTPIQDNGKVMAATNLLGFVNATVEPTGIISLDSFIVTPNSSTILYDMQYGDEPDVGFSVGFCLRMTAPATVNVRASLTVARN